MDAVTEDLEAVQVALFNRQFLQTLVLKIDDAMTLDADEMMVGVEIGIEAGLIAEGIHPGDEAMSLEEFQRPIDGPQR